jgi:hypothetical protein
LSSSKVAETGFGHQEIDGDIAAPPAGEGDQADVSGLTLI